MRRTLLTIAFCMIASTAIAQAPAGEAAQAAPSPQLIVAVSATPDPSEPKPKAAQEAGDEPSGRTGAAMLLAALALMTAIALRRGGAQTR